MNYDTKAPGFMLSDNFSRHQAKIKVKALAWDSPQFKRNKINAVY
ncbi:MAG: hypothetical protein WKF36_04935 [Candidatus Nitrosocosmicus sp.]